MKNSTPPTKGKEEGRTRDHPGKPISFWLCLKEKQQHASHGKADNTHQGLKEPC